MILGDRPYTFDRVFRLLAGALFSIGLIWLLKYLSDVLIPFAVAFLIAYLMNPLVNLLQRRIRYRGPAVFTALALVLIVIVITGLLITPKIKHEIIHMSTLISRVAQDGELAQRARQHLPSTVWEQIRTLARDDMIQHIRGLLGREDIWALMQFTGKKILPGLWQVIHGAASFLFGLVGLFIIMLYLIFMLLDYQRVKDEWKGLIPPPWRPAILAFIDDFNNGMHQYFRSQALVAFLVGILFAVGFSLIGLPMGILLGLFVGALNMVPYLQTIGLVPAGLLALVRAIETGANPWTIIGLTLLVFAVIQAIQDGVLVPRIMGKVTGLSPAMILLSLSVWGKMLGMFGLIIALPLTCLLLAYYRRLTAAAGAGSISQAEQPPP
ncbi:MAG: AI-2E family transporter [Deltaproteobacteria bacterium]|nr:AI-2E family transporter [Deltaproteobacteria bacterium]